MALLDAGPAIDFRKTGSRWHPLPKLFIPCADLEVLKPWRFGFKTSDGIYIELPRGDFAKELSRIIADGVCA